MLLNKNLEISGDHYIGKSLKNPFVSMFAFAFAYFGTFDHQKFRDVN
jgi:hypothetical protein